MEYIAANPKVAVQPACSCGRKPALVQFPILGVLKFALSAAAKPMKDS